MAITLQQLREFIAHIRKNATQVNAAGIMTPGRYGNIEGEPTRILNILATAVTQAESKPSQFEQQKILDAAVNKAATTARRSNLLQMLKGKPDMNLDQNGAVVLFSGGQDSATCLAWALDKFNRVETVGFVHWNGPAGFV